MARFFAETIADGEMSRALAIGLLLIAALLLSLYVATKGQRERSTANGSALATRTTDKETATEASPRPAPLADNPAASSPKSPSDPASRSSSSFLESFGDRKSEAGASEPAGTATDQELEKNLLALDEAGDRLEALRSAVAANPELAQDKETLAERDRLIAELNQGLAMLEKRLARAREARPGDLVPQWLTGELLMLAGGEPDRALPYLERAAAGGLDRPRLTASLARAQLDMNRFDQAYASAAKALEASPRDRYVWMTFTRVAFSNEKFARVLEQLDSAFGGQLPDWAARARRDAAQLLSRWQREQTFRQAAARADDLPRVRLTIEHRHFARGADGQPLNTVQTAGREQVVVELFEDQAPVTVANFLDLVEKKFYDGTRFHLAEAATLVTGGDPNSRSADPSQDGAGGPGYLIPDEFDLPTARDHFRGSLSMVNTGPQTAGSQFFITLAPRPGMNGHFTVFGRVVEGQAAVDHITPGRTTPEVGRYGKTIPGDLLVRAEVLRKRPHPYRVDKVEK
jgi:cyclophilin family peptidyl-prolyl cis-trans isomerase/tetratricopeptide (TPR) repeat protein